MDDLIAGGGTASRPVFLFKGPHDLTAAPIPTGQLRLSGPAEKLDAAHWPVRGDLAHIRLAGRCFVPHYAVPMERLVVSGGANLLATHSAEAEVREALSGGTPFNVLDVAGDWAWGQVGEDGFVGYLPLGALEAQ